MLQSLHIINFAIIEDTVIDFDQGVTVFTGETGAGKSILIDALAMLTGRRASTDLIRTAPISSKWKVSFMQTMISLTI